MKIFTLDNSVHLAPEAHVSRSHVIKSTQPKRPDMIRQLQRRWYACALRSISVDSAAGSVA
jgi:hypothetical protein